MDTAVSYYAGNMESGTTKARGTQRFGERGGLLAGRLAAGFCITGSDSQAVEPGDGSRSAEARGTQRLGVRGGLLAGRLAAGFCIRRSDSQAVEPGDGSRSAEARRSTRDHDY